MEIEWDAGSWRAAEDNAAWGEREFEPAVLEGAIDRLVAGELDPEDTVRRISISDVGYGSPARAVRLFIEVDAPDGPAREFWRLEPTAVADGPWRLTERFRHSLSELHQPDGIQLTEGLAVFGTVNVYEREWPPPTLPERRFLLSGRRADGSPAETVLRWPWFPADEQAARALGGSVNPGELRIVELLPPFPPWSAAQPPDGRFSLAWYAASRGLEPLNGTATPRDTWALRRLVESRSHDMMRGWFDHGVNGTLVFGERAVHSSRGNLWEAATLAVCSVATVPALQAGLVCLWRSKARFLRMHDPLPDGLSEVSAGDPEVDRRYVIAVAEPAAADLVRALFANGFGAWLSALPWDDHALRFELLGQTLCAYVPRVVGTAAELDELRARAAMIVKRLQTAGPVEAS